ncbi:hypothetical protein DFJ77DRAFT_507730 [Powellomyces hirtus]|nr:hypothetical protein DFJ77DRAFT_507730 [Powellomyces hirtus]
MGRRSYKEFFAWINFNVETGAGPMKREELRKRLASRIARGLFKSFVFSALRSALTFIGSPDIALIWTKTAILSPQRHLIAVAMGVSLYLWIGALADVILGLAEFSMGIRMADVFDYSLCATSLRRFWGRQWNRPFQEALKNTVVLSDEEEAGGKTPGATMVQMFAVFIISGLFHDIINYRCFDTLSLTTVMFFVLQGAGCALEARIAHSHTYQRLPKVAKWAIVMGFLTLTGPLFVKPYILKGGMYAMPCPHF